MKKQALPSWQLLFRTQAIQDPEPTHAKPARRCIVENIAFIRKINSALLPESEEQIEKTELQDRPENLQFFKIDDTSKFDDFQTFIRSLIVIFHNQKPDALFHFIVEELLPMYREFIKAPRDLIVNSK